MSNGNSAIVFVIEDEDSLRRLLCQTLQSHGYSVLEAGRSDLAQEVWKARGSDISLILADIMLPGGLTGWDLAREFLKERPDIKILYMSGFFGDVPAELTVNESNFMRKPFLPRELVSRVRALLETK
ncbi:MAG: response regulator [Verrucomicrobiota bacterium]